MSYKAGDRFKVINGHDYAHNGDIVQLVKNDGTNCPWFINLTANRKDIPYGRFACNWDRLEKLPYKPKTKVMSYEEFRDYLKEHGQTVAMTTKAWKNIPRGTKIKFVHYLKSVGKELISSYGSDGVKDQFSYPFDIRWDEIWCTEYPGQFEVELKEEAPSKTEMSNYVNSMAIPEPTTYKTTTVGTEAISFYTPSALGTVYNPWPENNLTTNKPKNKLMTNIVEFAKNLTLTEDERALRKTGLQDENGNWTVNAKEIAISLLTDGKKEELIQIAKAKLAEEKKCAK